MSGATIDEVVATGAPAAWRAAGFAVEGDVCLVGTVALRLAGTPAGPRIAGWSLRGVSTTELDGLPTSVSTAPERPAAPTHPNSVTRLDHVVAFSPDLDRTIAALEAAGLDLRRVREEPTPAGAPRQAFFRLGAEILEVIQQPPDAPGFDPNRPARLWGLAFEVASMDDCAAALGDLLGEPRDAVQPGRTIATLRREAELGVPVAFMTPAPAPTAST